MSTARTTSVKYVFLDVVRFTHNRSVEAQVDIVGFLNQIVTMSIERLSIPREHLRLLHTGDGICIAIQRMEDPYDVHMLLACEIVTMVTAHNDGISDEMRRFEVRVGINANVDNIVIDINNEQNLAGAGINIAQRVMSAADGNQILIGRAVYETLAQRESYMGRFRPYTAEIKHGHSLSVYQYIDDRVMGLNTEVPAAFKPSSQARGLTRVVAYYIAHAYNNKTYLVSVERTSTMLEAVIILLFLLAEDSIGIADATEYTVYDPQVKGSSDLKFSEQLKYYDDLDFWCNVKLAEYITDEHLIDFVDCFEESDSVGFRFVTPIGLERLRSEWPQIASEFGFV